jgi:hypothetical protein
MLKKINPICEHIDWDNNRDCENEAEYMCMCCSVPVCSEHKTKECSFGGMGFIEL